MALNKEDKADVSRSMGKALANKVSKVTKDKKFKQEQRSVPPSDMARYYLGRK